MKLRQILKINSTSAHKLSSTSITLANLFTNSTGLGDALIVKLIGLLISLIFKYLIQITAIRMRLIILPVHLYFVISLSRM